MYGLPLNPSPECYVGLTLNLDRARLSQAKTLVQAQQIQASGLAPVEWYELDGLTEQEARVERDTALMRNALRRATR